MIINEIYINSILNNDECRNFITKILLNQQKRLSSLCIHADPEYEHELSFLITIHDIISQERFKTLLKSMNNEINFEEFSTIILSKQQV
ncbi:unnamed protein product [Rotaria sp. Silwood1]|nr:unnamed protein product [Rotaria sp. Silwood1]